jgi:hypothetical protein
MAPFRADFRKAMAQVLSSHGVARINFTIRKFRVNGALYVKLKRLLTEANTSQIEFDSPCFILKDSQYNTNTNK